MKRSDSLCMLHNDIYSCLTCGHIRGASEIYVPNRGLSGYYGTSVLYPGPQIAVFKAKLTRDKHGFHTAIKARGAAEIAQSK